jgi:dihydroorotate dehydrogenase (fumarate)/dihydroorotate dehydrogenase (NAD+) catalytic subunit
MIELSNRYKFEYMAASGALAFDGKGWFHEQPLRWLGLLDPSLFTIVAKTITYKSRKGNYLWYCPWKCIHLMPGGAVNAVGLTNPGFSWWLRKTKQNKKSKISLIASIFSDSEDAAEELALMAANIEAFIGVKGIEINASCPNTQGDNLSNTKRIIESCEKVKRVTSFLPLILKLSVVHNINEILPNIKGIIEAISINSVPWRIVFPDKESPLAYLGGGGVSGKIAQPFTWKFVERIINETDIPVIGPSVWNFDDIQKLRDLGAKAISFGSIFLRYPWRSTQFVREDMKRNRIQE